MDSAERLKERLDKLPENEREPVAKQMLAELDERQRVLALLAPAIREIERGEARPLESHGAFTARMKQRRGFP